MSFSSERKSCHIDLSLFDYLKSQPIFPELYIKLLAFMNIKRAEDFFDLPLQKRKLEYMIELFVHSHDDVLLRTLFGNEAIKMMAASVEKVLHKGRQAFDLFVR